MPTLPTIDCAAELTALHAAIADLEARLQSIPPQLFTLRHRVKALEAYALTLPPATPSCPHGRDPFTPEEREKYEAAKKLGFDCK